MHGRYDYNRDFVWDWPWPGRIWVRWVPGGVLSFGFSIKTQGALRSTVERARALLRRAPEK